MSGFDVTPEKRATQGAFMKRQLFVNPPVVSRHEVDLGSKTAIITGSNTGLGLECARQLLDLGIGRLILAVRSESKGQAAKKNLLAGRTSNKQVVDVWSLDLASYESITSFAERAKGLDRLDIFIENAGITKSEYETCKSTGHEETVQVNYLSLVLLTILFLPILKEKNLPEPPGRLVLVNSEVSAWAKFKEKDSVPLLAELDKASNFKQQERYSTSKLLCQLFLVELNKRIPPSVAVINAPNPGLCKSDLYREFSGNILGFLFGIFRSIVARTISVGARTLTDAAVKHGQESHGQYLEDCKIQPQVEPHNPVPYSHGLLTADPNRLAPIVYKPEGHKITQQLWKETMEELAFAKAADIVDSLSVK